MGKKPYEEAEFEVIYYKSEDSITSSSGGSGGGKSNDLPFVPI